MTPSDKYRAKLCMQYLPKSFIKMCINRHQDRFIWDNMGEALHRGDFAVRAHKKLYSEYAQTDILASL